MKQENNIQKSGQFLEEMQKENNFSVPKTYFEVLPEVISNKILDNKRLYFNFDKMSYRILVPICTILFVLSLFYFWNYNQSTTPLTSDQISEVLINENYYEFEEEMLIETYAELLAENESTIENDEPYIDYLIENDIELETLIESY